MTQGIILAGGRSERASTNKLLFTVGGRILLEHALDAMRPFVRETVIVTGAHHASVVDRFREREDVLIAYNPDYREGMFTSVLCGAKVAKEDVFILPADCPFVAGATYAKLLGGTAEIRVPRHQGRLGHPIWLSASIRETLANQAADTNLKAFRDRIGFECIDTDDAEVLSDLDTAQDLEDKKLKYERTDGHED